MHSNQQAIMTFDWNVLYLHHENANSGLTGFDGEMKWYVSTRRLVGYLLNLSEQKINWRK